MAFSDFIDLKYLICWLISLLPTDVRFLVDPIDACRQLIVHLIADHLVVFTRVGLLFWHLIKSCGNPFVWNFRFREDRHYIVIAFSIYLFDIGAIYKYISLWFLF